MFPDEATPVRSRCRRRHGLALSRPRGRARLKAPPRRHCGQARDGPKAWSRIHLPRRGLRRSEVRLILSQLIEQSKILSLSYKMRECGCPRSDPCQTPITQPRCAPVPATAVGRVPLPAHWVRQPESFARRCSAAGLKVTALDDSGEHSGRCPRSNGWDEGAGHIRRDRRCDAIPVRPR